MSKVDVAQIAESMKDELYEKLMHEMDNLKNSIDTTNFNTVVAGTMFVMKNHTEQFVIKLLQRVVDEIHQTDV